MGRKTKISALSSPQSLSLSLFFRTLLLSYSSNKNFELETLKKKRFSLSCEKETLGPPPTLVGITDSGSLIDNAISGGEGGSMQLRAGRADGMIDGVN